MDIEELNLNSVKSLGSIKKQKKAKKSVIEKLEDKALNLQNQSSKKKSLSTDEIRFCSRMIEKRGLDYKVQNFLKLIAVFIIWSKFFNSVILLGYIKN